MTNNRFYLPVFAILLLTSLVILGACQRTENVQPLALAPAVGVSTDFDYEQAAENKAYRWNAMAMAYERNGLLNSRTDPDDILVYRWNAMTEAYKRNGLLNSQTDPDDILVYRWAAMAKFYDDNGLLVGVDEIADDSTAFRWLAMAKFYEKKGLLTRDPVPSELSTQTVATQD